MLVQDSSALWRARLQAGSTGDMTVKRWCETLGCTLKQYYYWKRRLNPSTPNDKKSEPRQWLVADLKVDNNRAERAVKPFVIGRKNRLFANTPCGAQSSAVSYSVVETAKQNGLNPLAYLTHVFSTLHPIASQGTEALDALMPWSEAMQTRFNIDKQSPA